MCEFKMNMDHHDKYVDEDSNHSYNGWIKEEIPEYEEIDEYNMKPGDETSDRYEELMSMSKDDLVAQILQQEEEIRNIRDIRNGIELHSRAIVQQEQDLQNLKELKTGLDLSAKDISNGCTDFRKLLTTLSSVLKSYQRDKSPNSPHCPPTSTQSKPAVAGAYISARGNPNTMPLNNPVGQRVTNANSNVRPVPTMPSNAARSQNVPSNQVSTFVNKDMQSPSTASVTSQTVTFTKTTVIKTEIPSPPPPEVELNQVQPIVTHPTNTIPSQRSQCSFQTTQQRMKPNSSTPVASPMQTRSNPMMNIDPQAYAVPRKRPRTNNQQVFRTIPQQRGVHQVRPEMAFHNVRTRAPNPSMQTQNAFQVRPVKVNAQQLGRNVYQPQVRTQPIVTSPGRNTATESRPRQQNQMPVSSSHPLSTPSPSSTSTVTTTAASPSSSAPMNNLLSNIKFPSELTLSLVNPKANSAMKTARTEKPSSSSKVSSSDGMTTRSGVAEDKNFNDQADIKSSAEFGAVSNTMNSYEEEEEEEDGEFDEIAVLIPDKGNAADQKLLTTDMKQSLGENRSGKDENATKKSQPYYRNNSEYVLEELDDGDSDEHQRTDDTKAYMAENISIPKEIIKNCRLQGDTPIKLTRNLMTALFPDIREMASACHADITKSVQPALPENKIQAIIDLVHQSFPDCKRASIITAMNVKCNEAKVLISRNQATRSRKT